jgi:hypothetical protein
MTCAAAVLSASTSCQNFLGAGMPKRSRCGNSFLAFEQGIRRKACLERY